LHAERRLAFPEQPQNCGGTGYGGGLARRDGFCKGARLFGHRKQPCRMKESTSFLKKRSKKLLSVTGSTKFTDFALMLRAIDKNFLLLFFKKEVLLPRPRRQFSFNI
jgi:hypothetical protein